MNIDTIARNAYRCARMPASMEAYTGVTMRRQSEIEGHKPTDTYGEWFMKSGTPRPDSMREKIKAHLRDNGPATAPTIAAALRRNRGSVSAQIRALINAGEVCIAREYISNLDPTIYAVTE